jgi:hypothetical protein
MGGCNNSRALQSGLRSQLLENQFSLWNLTPEARVTRRGDNAFTTVNIP